MKIPPLSNSGPSESFSFQDRAFIVCAELIDQLKEGVLSSALHPTSSVFSLQDRVQKGRVPTPNSMDKKIEHLAKQTRRK